MFVRNFMNVEFCNDHRHDVWAPRLRSFRLYKKIGLSYNTAGASVSSIHDQSLVSLLLAIETITRVCYLRVTLARKMSQIRLRILCDIMDRFD